MPTRLDGVAAEARRRSRSPRELPLRDVPAGDRAGDPEVLRRDEHAEEVGAAPGRPVIAYRQGVADQATRVLPPDRVDLHTAARVAAGGRAVAVRHERRGGGPPPVGGPRGPAGGGGAGGPGPARGTPRPGGAGRGVATRRRSPPRGGAPPPLA